MHTKYTKLSKKKFPHIAFIMVLTLMLPTLAAAATWHSSTITLPRTGSWLTQARAATSGTQQTKVTDNKYEANSVIVRSSNGKEISSWVNHKAVGKAGYAKAYKHKTSIKKGTKIKAKFKTNWHNFKTLRAKLSWAP